MIEWGIFKILIKFIEENKKAFVFIKYGSKTFYGGL
ncbi:branched-chain amino acid aminotransferase I [Helicobacter pylori]|nr:branched-chain amino acid aminotransferase I [Helicobacter pylori]